MSPKRRNIIAIGIALAAGASALAYGVLRWRNDPSARPYSQRLWMELPRPFFTRARLREMLVPEPGQKVLEVGPGTGYYALHTAQWLSPGGTLEILDLQQTMLDHTMHRAQELGVTNIVPTLGDAQVMPYTDDTFDAAYLVATLGEASDQSRVLRELSRVLKPGGRLIVGEGLPDPHMVRVYSLHEQTEAADLVLERRVGGTPAYFASFKAT